MRPGIWQILIVVLVIVLIFGATKLPSLAKNLGKSMKVFRDEVKDLTKDGDDTDAAAQAPQQPEIADKTGSTSASTPGATTGGGTTAATAADATDTDKTQHSN